MVKKKIWIDLSLHFIATGFLAAWIYHFTQSLFYVAITVLGGKDLIFRRFVILRVATREGIGIALRRQRF